MNEKYNYHGPRDAGQQFDHGNAVAGAPPTPKNVPELRMALEANDKRLQHLFNIIESLEQRLSDVMMPLTTDTGAPVGLRGNDFHTAIAAAIDNQGRGLGEACTRLSSIRDRLAV
jgi:hypothetical protein